MFHQRSSKTDEGPIAVKTFQDGSSVHNTPIERSWRYTNDVTRKYLVICDALAAEGVLQDGRNCDDIDVWCFHKVFLPAIKTDVEMHYKRMNAATRRRSTKCPGAPVGIPDVNYLSLPSQGTGVDTAQIHELRDFATDYCQRSLPAHAECPVRASWEIDPLAVFDDARAGRDLIFNGWKTLELPMQYKKLRELTHTLLDLQR